jgi:hypothetical protein
MKFRSPTDEPLHVGLTTGHTCVIPPPTPEDPSGVEIHKRFHREAIRAGALPEGVQAEEKEDAGPTRSDILEKAIQSSLDGNEPDDFNRDGSPNLTALQRRVGFKLAREEVNAAWAKFKAIA